MNKKEANKILEKGEYPTQKTIKAFAAKYPELFRKIAKEILKD